MNVSSGQTENPSNGIVTAADKKADRPNMPALNPSACQAWRRTKSEPFESSSASSASGQNG